MDQPVETPRLFLLVRSSAEPLSDAQVGKIRFELVSTFRNAQFCENPLTTESRVAYMFHVDLLCDEAFPFDGSYFLERIGLDPSVWQLVMEVF